MSSPYTIPTGVTYDSGEYARGRERALELVDYTPWRERARQPRGSTARRIVVRLATIVKASGAEGVGQAVTEGTIYTPEGLPMTGTLVDYAIPKAAEIPALLLETMGTPSPTNLQGVKSIGELPTVAAPAAFRNSGQQCLRNRA